MVNWEEYFRREILVFHKVQQEKLKANNFVVKKEWQCNCGQQHINHFYFKTEQEVQDFVRKASLTGERILSVSSVKKVED